VYLLFILPFWGIPFNHSRNLRVPLTPPWALECWLWEDDQNTSAAVQELLSGYAKNDLPVRTILIDSPWSQRYNDFKVDGMRYPEPEKFFRDLKSKGYRIVLWMTCMVNSRNKDTSITNSQAFYDQARTQGYLAGAGFQLSWWKGRGGFIDYTNPRAMRWWHGLQDQVFDWGIDGWKLDGADTFFSGKISQLPVPFNRTASGWLTTRRYMDRYGREEYQYGLTRNPEFAILVRSLDHPWSHPEGFSPLDAATVTWVGDNRHTWAHKQRGLEAALTDVLQSAKLGYCVIGSDVAGYHGRGNPDDMGPATAAWLQSHSTPVTAPPSANPESSKESTDPIPPNVYIRWAQFSTFCGLFLNGGHGERRLWKRSWPELEIIRKFSWLHTELVPYMYSHVVQCHNGGLPLMRPLSQGKFHYLFGEHLLVAPIYADRSEWKVSLPAGQWRYFFNDDEILSGPTTIRREFPLDEYPVFVRDGAIIPLNVTRSYTGLGDTNSAGYTTWLVFPGGRSEFTLWHPQTHPHPVGTSLLVQPGTPLKLEFSGLHEPHLLRIRIEQKPARVVLDGKELAEGDSWTFDGSHHRLLIKTRDYTRGQYEIFSKLGPVLPSP